MKPSKKFSNDEKDDDGLYIQIYKQCPGTTLDTLIPDDKKFIVTNSDSLIYFGTLAHQGYVYYEKNDFLYMWLI